MRGGNGIIVVTPSVHPDPDGCYTWLQTGPVPLLPDYLAAMLPDASPGEVPATPAECEAFALAHAAGDRHDLFDVILAEIDRALPTSTRHGLFVSWTATAMREAAAGLYPAPAVLERLRQRFHDAEGVGEGRVRTPVEQEREWCGHRVVGGRAGDGCRPCRHPGPGRGVEAPVLTYNGQPVPRVEFNRNEFVGFVELDPNGVARCCPRVSRSKALRN